MAGQVNGQGKMGTPLLAGAGNGNGASYGGTVTTTTKEAVGGRFSLAAPTPAKYLNNGAFVNNMVCGAGPAGLLTACLLAKKGVPVTVFEMRERPTSFYGSFPVVLNMRGLTALSKLGENVLAKFKRLGRPVDELHIVPKNRTVAKTQTYGTCIMRDQAVGILLEEADRLGVKVHWRHKLLDIDIDTKTCTFERPANDGGVAGADEVGMATGEGKGGDFGHAAEKVDIKVGNIFGCDGNYSKVRRVLESKTALKVDEEDWGVLMRYMLAPDPPSSKPLPAEVNGKVHYVLGSDGYVCQQPDGVWSLSFSILDGSDDFLRSNEASAENIRKLRALCEANATPFAKHLLTSDEVYKTFFNCRSFNGKIVRCSTLAPAPFVALAGDAAHAVAPFTGEGINSALESGALLAEIIASGRTCCDYDAERREDAHALYEIALRNRSIVSGSGNEKCANTFSTAMLGIAKSLGCIAGTFQDYMLGAKAKESGVWRYRDLYAMDVGQRSCVYPLGECCFYICCCCCGRCD